MGVDPYWDQADPADMDAPAAAFPWRTPEGVEREAYIIASPIPYYPQERPAWWKRLLLFTVFRRWKCCYRWCSWPATERGFVCDRHGGAPDASGSKDAAGGSRCQEGRD